MLQGGEMIFAKVIELANGSQTKNIRLKILASVVLCSSVLCQPNDFVVRIQNVLRVLTQVWWDILVIPKLGKLRHKDFWEFEVSLGL